MIATVTPNPALDLTYRVEALRPGNTHKVSNPAVRAGGKGLNVARVARQAGFASVAITPVGGQAGAEFEEELRISGLPHIKLRVSVETRRSIAFVDESNGDATIFNEHGASMDISEYDSLLEHAARLSGTALCLVGSGSLPPGAPSNFYARLVTVAHNSEIPCIIDATGTELIQAAKAGATLVKPNRQELADSTGESDPIAGARQLLRLGVGIVLVSLGPEGILAVSAEEPECAYRAQLASPLVGNPTGAGDAAVAAAASCLAAGVRDLSEILRRATAWSAAAVMMPLAGEMAAEYVDIENRIIVTRA